MNKKLIFFAFAAVLFISTAAVSQTPSLIKRTIYKTDKLDFGSGGTVKVTGAPNGSIRIIGQAKNEIEISAEIEIQAATEEDLNTIAAVTGFLTDEYMGSVSVISTGTYDKKYLKRMTKKKFPKDLMGLPVRIDYIIKVPQYSDLDINGGDGDFELSGVSGAFKVNYLKTNAKLDLVGGGIMATFGSGNVDVFIPARSWSGRFLNISVASGTLNVSLPPGLNAEIDASVLRTGNVNNTYTNIKAERKKPFTPTSVVGKAGNGGVSLEFVVGDGDLNLFEMKTR